MGNSLPLAPEFIRINFNTFGSRPHTLIESQIHLDGEGEHKLNRAKI